MVLETYTNMQTCMAGRLFQNYLLTWQSPSAGQFIRCLIPNIEYFANQTSKLPKIESFAHRTSKLPIIESFAHRTSNCSRIEHRKCRKTEEYYRTSKFAHRTSNAHPDRSIRTSKPSARVRMRTYFLRTLCV